MTKRRNEEPVAEEPVVEESVSERQEAFAAEIARRVIALPTNTTSSGVTEEEVKTIVLGTIRETLGQ